MLIRLELLSPQGDLLQSTTYNKVFTQYGIIMVFFFLIPSIYALLAGGVDTVWTFYAPYSIEHRGLHREIKVRGSGFPFFMMLPSVCSGQACANGKMI